MKHGARAILASILLLPALAGQDVKLDYSRLQPALNELSDPERGVVNDAIRLIKSGSHSLALARLTELNQRNPQNSSLRILASYALLQLGNLAGAFTEAEKVHEATTENVYACWFLAKIALLNGKTAICRRELEHVRQSGQMAAQVKQLEKELEKP
ncbi:MAG: hypothetical protein KIT09_26675 [Bryobacteraceae bacterium]|nr:hypothetical protein [Bryobacteraceae bacterium]